MSGLYKNLLDSDKTRVDSIVKTICLSRDRRLAYYQYISIFLEILKKNNIQYFAYFGTALGIERHAGFIPWDDDFDIMIEDFFCEKLIDLIPELESFGVFLHKDSKDDFYQFYIKNSLIPETLVNYFPIDVFVAERVVIEGEISLHIKSKLYKQWFGNYYISLSDVYPLRVSQFGPLMVSTVFNPKRFFDRCGFSMTQATIKIHQVDQDWLRSQIDYLESIGMYPVTDFSIFDDYLAQNYDKCLSCEEFLIK